MRQKNQKSSGQRRERQSGQAFTETVLVLLVFVITLIAAVDFSQLMFTHQALVERVRVGLRYGMINQWDGTGDAVAYTILFNNANPSDKTAATFMKLKRENIQVSQVNGTVADPNDIRLKVSIVGYEFHLFTPFIAHAFTNNYAVVESAPILYRN